MCEERVIYKSNGINAKNIIWIEGNPEIFKIAKEKYKGLNIYNALISDTEEDVEFVVTNSTQSSSILELGEHLDEYPSVKEVQRLTLRTDTLDSFFEKEKIDVDYDFINMDVQGAELKVLKGISPKSMDKIKYIYAEVSYKPLYKGQGLFKDVYEYLRGLGFYLVDMARTNHGWGDALFVKMDFLTVLTFSKDRPMQLEALLRTTDKLLNVPHKMKVLYKATDECFDEGYCLLSKRFNNVEFIRETDFFNQTKAIVETANSRLFMFLVDDLIFRGEISYSDDIFDEFITYKDILFLSLRLGGNITSVCHYDKKIGLPKTLNRDNSKGKDVFSPKELNNNTWRWGECLNQWKSNGGWGYPMSVDANIYRREDICNMFRRFKPFRNPSDLEIAMMYHRDKTKPRGICYNESKVYNIQMNLTQNQYNRNTFQKYQSEYQNYTVAKLNSKFLDGYSMDVSDLIQFKNDATHNFCFDLISFIKEDQK